MSDPIHPEGIYQCAGCKKLYPEYVNGCVEDHPSPRRVELLAIDTPDSRLLDAIGLHKHARYARARPIIATAEQETQP